MHEIGHLYNTDDKYTTLVCTYNGDDDDPDIICVNRCDKIAHQNTGRYFRN